MSRSGHRFTCLPVLALLLLASPGRTSTAADAGAIVSAERAFAASVRSLGVRDGFLAWLAPASVVFKPGPVMGVAHHQKLPTGWHGLLAWNPVRAAISADGKLGWSTGPWIWKRDSTQKSADAHGEYMSVWRRQSDGRWRVVLDGGIGHGPPTAAEVAVTYSAPVPGARLGSRPLAARQSLYQADATFARLAASEGVPGALERCATHDVVVLREGSLRHDGRGAAVAALTGREARARLVSNAQYIAESGDLGYTYGSFITGAIAAGDTAWYVHVWHRGPAATWRLALQLVMPVPKKRS